MKPIIRVEGLGKQYRIGKRRGYKTLREALVERAAGAWRSLRAAVNGGGQRRRRDEGTIWALQDVGFEVMPGEVVGIIGRNGAGKSTLLKVLSRITEPTAGQVELYGRTASLLEVGTGFHPELTGRENVYLNGAILGMSRAEIRRKFDAIVAFAEVEDFLDTPVKHYSSGMYMRLAFAVAAYLEPEILVVDEVLAVGDVAFQKRCMAKMHDVGRQGRTVLFVSHNMPAVTRLCPRTILLSSGSIIADGPSHQVVSTYLQSGQGTTAAREWPDGSGGCGDDVVRLRAVRVRTEDGQVTSAFNIQEAVGIEIEFRVVRPGHVLVPNCHVYNDEGVCVFVTLDQDAEWRRRPRPEGVFVSTAWVPGNLLAEGTFIVTAAVSTLAPVTVHACEREAVAFQVVDSLEGNSARGDLGGHMPGVVRPLLRWTTQFRAVGEVAAAVNGEGLS